LGWLTPQEFALAAARWLPNEARKLTFRPDQKPGDRHSRFPLSKKLGQNLGSSAALLFHLTVPRPSRRRPLDA
jgi:hypothetical protein